MRIIMNIKEIRKSKKMSLEMLERKSGVSKSHINEVEKNYKIPSILVAIKIAKGLNVGLVDLFRLEL